MELIEPERDTAQASGMAEIINGYFRQYPHGGGAEPPGAAAALQMARHWARVKNAPFNLTAILDDAEAARKHYWDALSMAGFIGDGYNCLDLGSGAGFPGIPLCLVKPRAAYLLLEPTKKRAAFLESVLTELGEERPFPRHIEVCCARAEQAGRGKWRGKSDLVFARAVTALPVLIEYALPLLKVGGLLLAAKGPAAEQELIASEGALNALKGRTEDIIRYALPEGGERRTLVVIKKTGRTEPRYPRPSPKSKPL